MQPLVAGALAFYHAHPAACVASAYWLFSLSVDSMPTPEPGSGPGYRWLYAIGQRLAANLTKLQMLRGERSA